MPADPAPAPPAAPLPARARPARADVAFLADATWRLLAAGDYPSLLHTANRLAVPTLADWCLLDVREPEGVLRQAAGHPNVAARDLALQLGGMAANPDDGGRVAAALTLGLSCRVEAVGPDDLCLLGGNGRQARLLAGLGVTWYVVMPLEAAGGPPRGALTLLGTPDGRPLPSMALVEDFGRRVGAALAAAHRLRDTQAALRAREDLLVGLAHDLRNPLTAIRGYAQMLRTDADPGRPLDGPTVARAARHIEATAVRMGTLLSQVADVASGRQDAPRRAVVDLVGLAHEAVADWQIVSDRHQIVLDAPDGPVVGCWDAARLFRVLHNLLSNALKYSPDGGEVRLTVSPQRGDDGAGWARVDVVDHGVGIPAGDLPRLFDRFRRGGNVGRVEGSGIGLAAAHDLVAQHGGSIDVRSHEGLGTRCTVLLPLDGAPAPFDGAPAPFDGAPSSAATGSSAVRLR